MPRQVEEMPDLKIRNLRHPGGRANKRVAVGGVSGLLLQITPLNGKSWILRVKIGEKRREFGLGGYPDVLSSEARRRAREIKAKIRDGIDPSEERKSNKSKLVVAQQRGLKFRDAVDRYLAAKIDQHKNRKHRQQWANTLQTYVVPELGAILVQDITVQDVLRVLQPIWRDKTETATRVRGRIEAVLAWAEASGHRTGDNPARWAGNLKELLPAPRKIAKTQNHPALQIADVHRWRHSLQNMTGIARYGLEFALLTAARSKEVRGAKWSEINFQDRIWTIPANRMKMDREHRVPLSKQAFDLLTDLPRQEGNDLVFPATRGGEMSDMTMSKAMKRMNEAALREGSPGFLDRVSARPAVPHGLRSTFRDWVAEKTNFPGEMAEVALAHSVSNAVEAAYRRGDMMEKRRSMMQAWADYANGLDFQGNLTEIQDFR